MNLISRKHKLEVNNGNVLKTFTERICFEKEYRILTEAFHAGMRVPEIINVNNMTIEMSFIDGPVYSELKKDMTLLQIHSLCQWIFEYHNLFDGPRCDCNPRNFIWHDNQCYGIDFADPLNYSYPEHDVGSLILFEIMHENGVEYLRIAHEIFRFFKDRGYDPKLIHEGYLAEIGDVIYRQRKYFNRKYDGAALDLSLWHRVVTSE